MLIILAIKKHVKHNLKFIFISIYFIHKYTYPRFQIIPDRLYLNFGNYILCLIKFCIAIFCIIILDILFILYRFGTFCKQIATTITSNHSSDISLCTPGTHPLKYGTHSYCRLKSAYDLL